MLFSITLWADFFAMGVSLWLGFYLLGRGFPSRITLRAVIALLALSGFFLGAITNIFHQLPGSASLRAALLVIVLATWYSLTIQLLPADVQKKQRWVSMGIYIAGVVVIAALLGTRGAFVGEEGNTLWVAHMGMSLPFVIYGVFQVVVCAGILYNLLSGPRIGLSSRGIYFFIASLLPIGAVVYGVIALAIPAPMPRLIQDGLIFSGVFLLGYSVARYQTLIERRTTLQDFPISGLALLGLSAGYAWLAWRLGYHPETVALVMALTILTHSIYDLVREFLERQRYRYESAFRKQLRQLENLENDRETHTESLQKGLELLCQTIGASGGWIAERKADRFVVTASYLSLPLDSQIPLETISCEELQQPVDPSLANVAWMAPAFAAETQVAVLALNSPQARLHYSPDDLDLLAEVADRVGVIVSLASLHPDKSDQIKKLVADAQSEAEGIRSSANALMATLVINPDVEFVHMVEDALRNLSDYIILGEHPLAERAGITGANHIERGQNLNQRLIQAIEALRPAGQRPHEPLPRQWYNYVVLYDAYVECVPNREIMARLYISEGTFNRTRRNALRGLARLLLEKK